MMRISDLVLLNDHHLIVLNKPAGMPVQDDPSGDKSLHRIAQAYCKRDLFLVNRIDRPCSGLVLMAKTREAAAMLSDQWQNREITKTYLAAVPSGISPEGMATHILVKRGNKTQVHDADRQGAAENAVGTEATLHWRVLQVLDNYDILEVKTATGFYHQIRAQCSALGYPIKGDVKYGARRANSDRSVGLHCREISCIHPGSFEMVTYVCPLPETDIWKALRSDETIQ